MDEALGHVLSADPRIAFALRFGSAARGETTSFSDVDVAIGLRAGERLDAYAIGELTVRLEQAAGRDIDLVLLDEAPPALAYRVFVTAACSSKRIVPRVSIERCVRF